MNMIENRKAKAGQGGFTLIELLVVVAILAVLGGAAIIGIGSMRSASEQQVCKTDAETIELAREAAKVGSNSATYSHTMATLVSSSYLKATPKGAWTFNADGSVTATSYGNLDSAGLTACNA